MKKLHLFFIFIFFQLNGQFKPVSLSQFGINAVLQPCDRSNLIDEKEVFMASTLQSYSETPKEMIDMGYKDKDEFVEAQIDHEMNVVQEDKTVGAVHVFQKGEKKGTTLAFVSFDHHKGKETLFVRKFGILPSYKGKLEGPILKILAVMFKPQKINIRILRSNEKAKAQLKAFGFIPSKTIRDYKVLGDNKYFLAYERDCESKK